MPKENKKNSTNAVESAKVDNVSKAPEQTLEKYIINEIVMRNVDRTPKDVGNWRDAHRAAESIYYPNRTRLYDLYADVILDGHLSGIMMKRIDMVVNKNFRFVDSANEEVEEVCDLIQRNEFRNVIKGIITSVFWGVTGFEFLPGDEFTFKEIPRKHIKPEKKVIAINQTDYDGIAYEDLSNVWVVGDERDLGILLKCAFYALLKKGSYTDWATYIEIFGQPMVIFRYDAYDEKTKAQLTNMIDNIGSSLRVSMPKQAEVEVMDGKTSNGNGDLQRQFVDACNQEMSVIVLGNTETTKSSKSSGYAQSKTHLEQQIEVTNSDIQFVKALLNSNKFLTILKSYGYQVEGGKFTVDEETDVTDLLVESQVDTALKNIGLPLDDDEMYERYNRNKPENYDEQMAQKEEERQMKLQPPANDPQPPPKDKKQKTDKKLKDQKATLNQWQKLMARLSDFFDQAHKD